MHNLSVDIETYSSVDIKKSGLYKYVQSDDFEILLFAYSSDGSPVRVVDLANGEKIPDEVETMLFWEACTNHAYNAAFEWYCLSKYFGVAANAWLSRWRCTMLHGLYCGFPAGLDSIDTALGLPQDKKKLGIGKALINYFCKPCKPTAANGYRTRNLPAHAPEKWELFKRTSPPKGKDCRACSRISGQYRRAHQHGCAGYGSDRGRASRNCFRMACSKSENKGFVVLHRAGGSGYSFKLPHKRRSGTYFQLRTRPFWVP